MARLALAVATRLSPRARGFVCRSVADLAFATCPSLRRRASRNLRLALGADAPGARMVFRGLAASLDDTIALLAGGAPTSAAPRPDAPSFAVLRAALAGGKGVVFATAHLGSWERMAAVVAAAGFPVVVVARESYDPRFHRVYSGLREAHGVRTIYRGSPGFGAAIVRALRANCVVGFAIDLGGRVRTADALWFGLPAPTPVGPATLALRTGAALVVGTPAPAPGGRRLLVERVEVPAGPASSERVAALTAELAERLSARIAALPTDWPWMHPRW